MNDKNFGKATEDELAEITEAMGLPPDQLNRHLATLRLIFGILDHASTYGLRPGQQS